MTPQPQPVAPVPPQQGFPYGAVPPNPMVSNTNYMVSNANAIVSNIISMVINSKPMVSNTNPMASNTNSMMINTKPMVSNTYPMASNTNPRVININPMVSNTNPIASNINPMVINTDPMVSNTTSMVINTNPMVSNNNHMVSNANPIVSNTRFHFLAQNCANRDNKKNSPKCKLSTLDHRSSDTCMNLVLYFYLRCTYLFTSVGMFVKYLPNFNMSLFFVGSKSSPPGPTLPRSRSSKLPRTVVPRLVRPTVFAKLLRGN